MSKHFCQRLGWVAAAIAAWATCGAAWGQDGQMPPTANGQYVAPAQGQQGSDPLAYSDIRARLEQQDQEIHQLQAQLAAQQGTPAATAPYAGAVGADASAAAPAGSAAAGKQVGSDLSGIVFFKDGEFLNFSTPNKDFTMHLGGWVQWDNTWWANPKPLTNPKGVNPGGTAAGAGIASGVAGGGVGNFSDGDTWRRLRLVQEGTFWETGIYRFNWAFENDQWDTTGLDEMWVGYTKIPVVGTTIVGHIKCPMGLEGDMTSSSRCMTFMERSSYSEAIELNQNFVNGLWFGNSYYDDRMEWMASAFRPDPTEATGEFFGTGAAGVQARFTALPLYEDEGRHLLHLGISGGWRNGAPSATGGPNVVDLRARPEMRDDNSSGAGLAPNANDNRMVDTGVFDCDQEYILGTELLYIRGPMSLQCEYGWNFLDNATPQQSPGITSNYMFNGGYIQFAYTLTGEHRAYDKKNGGLSRYYFGTQGPYENAFAVRDENGCLCLGRGAWELACRYSYIDLNDGIGAARVQGGIMDGVSVALNWYFNTNLTLMMDGIFDTRRDLPVSTVAGVTGIPGTTETFACRVQYSF